MYTAAVVSRAEVIIKWSLRSRLVAAVLAWTIRALADLSAPRGLQLAIMRRMVDGVAARGNPVRVGSTRGLWVPPLHSGGAPGVILYLHGGGLVFGSPRSHYNLVKRLSAASGLAAYLPEYRLAPEHRFPAAADDVVAAYRGLLEAGHHPARIAIAGDSAGGTLAATLLNDIKAHGLPMPAATLMMSPGFEIGFPSALLRDQQSRDPVLSPSYGNKCFAAYIGETEPTHPRIDTLAADKHGWPPTLIQAGGTECLLADAELMADSLRSAGVPCELQVWPGQVHVFQALARFVPEARTAIGCAGEFLRTSIASAAEGNTG
jgi:epsilon-lactone hydrolase